MAKKKLTKKEKQRLVEAEAKRKALEEEAERLRLQKEEKERLKREAKEAKERAEREITEHHIRLEHLGGSCKLFEEYQKEKLKQDIALREAEEWKLYLECNGLPNPANLPEMNTYLFLWKLDKKTNFIDDNLPKTQEVLNLLSVLDNLIDNPLNNTRKQVENWKEVRNNFREELQNRLDNSSFHILRQLETNMEPEDLETVTYFKECPFLILCMWTVLKIPRAFNDARPPPFIEFPQVGVTIQLPPKFTHSFPVVRAMWLRYDHYSDLCRSWEAKPLPEEYLKNLNDLKTDEWEEKQRIKNEQDAEEAARLEKLKMKKKKKYYQPPPEVTEAATQIDNTSLGENKPVEATPSTEVAPASGSTAAVPTSSSTAALPTVPTATMASGKQEEAPFEPALDKPPEPRKKPSEIMEERELKSISDLRRYLEVELEPGELNMRRYTVLAGIFHLDLLEQPPQPKILRDRTLLTVLEGEHKLQHIDFYEEYHPKLPDKEATGDETDAETKAALESAQLKLVAINIALPESVLWFEPPTAVQWNKHKKIWSTVNIHDPKFNEEKQILTFKTGLMSPVGLATFRFVNLPYQTWELRPDWKGPPGGVFLSITAATVIVEFIIRANQVCMNQLQNATSTALQEIVGIFYPPHQLIRKMRQGGIDLFPEHDAYLYVEGVTQKHYTAENHLYHCMALYSTTYNFSWSRWNLLAGRNNMVMQDSKMPKKKPSKKSSKKGSKKSSSSKRGSSKKKKLSKKERQKLAEIEAKRKAAEEEAERIRIKKEEKERIKREAEEAKERAVREVAEHHGRLVHLADSCKLLELYQVHHLQQAIALREAEEWQIHLECKGLPNPANLAEMNRYLYTWKNEEKTNFIDDNLPKTEEVLNLISALDNLIDNPLNNTRKQVQNWKEVQNKFREELQDRLDNCSFNILRHLETKMTPVDLETVNYYKECPYLILCMWTVLKIPRALNDDRPPPFIEFPQVGVTIQLTPKLTHSFPVVRAMWLQYDHYSDLCRTWEAKPLPDEYSKSLIDLKTHEWDEKQRVKHEQEAEEAARLEKLKKKGKKKWWSQPSEVVEAPPPTPPQTDTASLGENKLVEGAPSPEALPPSDSTGAVPTSGSAGGIPTGGSTAVIPTSDSAGPIPTTPTASIAAEPTTPPTPTAATATILTTGSTTASAKGEEATSEHTISSQEPHKRPSEIMVERELNKISDLGRYLEMELEPGELNMRKYTVLGGVYHLDLIEQPPQPKILPDRNVLTVLEGEYKLHHMDFNEERTEQLLADENTGDETDAENKSALSAKPDTENKSALKSAHPDAENKSALKSAQPDAENKSALESAQPDAENKSALESAQPDAENKSALESVQSGTGTDAENKSVLKSAHPDAENKSVLKSAHPDAQNKSALKSAQPDADNKSALESAQPELIEINISLPNSVLWFEPPTVVQWNREKKIWSDIYIHELKFDEEKQTVSFQTGLMSPVGLATFRFVNLPYQDWELRPVQHDKPEDLFEDGLDNDEVPPPPPPPPLPPEEVVLSITAATVTVEFIIRSNQVCLNQLQNAKSEALQEIVGIFYPPHQLIRKMRQGGIDLFPEHDAYLYVEGVAQKHYNAENHLYHCMALFSTTYNFAWSRWNLEAGRNDMVMQVREFVDRKRLPNYQMLQVTPLRACIVDCTEVSQAFSQTGVEGMKFYPDLYMLVREHASSTSQEKFATIDLALVETVYQMLFSCRVLSYS